MACDLMDFDSQPDVQRNGILAENDSLVPVWRLIAQTSSREESFVGLCSILGISDPTDLDGSCTTSTMYGSATVHLHWAEYPAAPHVKVFR